MGGTGTSGGKVGGQMGGTLRQQVGDMGGWD